MTAEQTLQDRLTICASDSMIIDHERCMFEAADRIDELERQLAEAQKDQAIHQDLVIELGVPDGGSVLEAVSELQKQVQALQAEKSELITTLEGLVDAIEYTPLGLRSMKAMNTAKNTIDIIKGKS